MKIDKNEFKQWVISGSVNEYDGSLLLTFEDGTQAYWDWVSYNDFWKAVKLEWFDK